MLRDSARGGPVKVYADAPRYESKLRRVMDRLGVTEFDWDHNRHEAWIQFRYKGGLYRFEQTVARAQANELKLHYGSDCFAQLVLALEDLARLVARRIFDLQTWIVGMKALPAHVGLPQCLEFFGFKEMPDAEAIKARYRELVRQLHPDAGGSPGDFQKLTQAYEQALSFVGDGGPRT